MHRTSVYFFVGFITACSASPNDTDAQSSGGAKPGTGGSPATGGSGGNSSVAGSAGTSGTSASAGASNGGASSGGSNTAGTATAGTDSGGQGGGPALIIGACDGLGGVDEFQTITPPGVAFVGSVAVDPVNSGTVYVGTGASSGTGGAAQGFLKSTDCGATWTKVSTGANGELFDAGTNYGIIVDWFQPEILFSATLYGANLSFLKSSNSGVDWQILFPAGSDVQKSVPSVFTQEFSIDAEDHAHVAVSFHDACTGEYAPMCLGETRDSGTTWHLLKGPLDGWGENARPFVLGTKSLLFISYFGAYYTADSTVDAPSWEKIAGYGGHAYRAKNGNFYLASYSGTNRSTDGGATWSLIEGSPRGYAISGDGDRIFVGGDIADNYHTALESNDSEWQSLSAPSTPDLYITFDYDAGHHLLYSANHLSGLLRMVTK